MTRSVALLLSALAVCTVQALVLPADLGQPSQTTGSSPSRSPQSATGTGLVLGKVIDVGTGKPVAGAVVTVGRSILGRQSTSFGNGPSISRLVPSALDGSGISSLRVMTDGEGRFVFRDLPSGSFVFSVSVSGYVGGGYGQRRPSGDAQTLELGDGEKRSDVILAVWRYGAIRGLVTDEAGEPVVGMPITVLRRTTVAGHTTLAPSGQAGQTDDRGQYRVGLLVPGDYVVAATVTQTTAPLAGAIASQASPGSFPLGSSQSIQVGDVIRTIRPGVVAPGPTAGGREVAYHTTFHPSAQAADDATPVTVGSGDERNGVDLQIRLAPTIRLSGRVMGPEGLAPGVSVRLVPAGASSQASESGLEAGIATSDASGSFTLLGIGPGRYVLRAIRAPSPGRAGGVQGLARGAVPLDATVPSGRGPGPVDSLLWAVMPIEAGDTDVTGLTVVLQSGVRLAGRARFEGSQPQPSGDAMKTISVTVDRADARTASGVSLSQPPVTLDATGLFTTTGVEAGRYLIRVLGAPSGWTLTAGVHEGRDISVTPVELSGSDVTGVDLVFSDRPTELSGSVRNADGPDGNAVVLLFPTDDQRWVDYGPNPRQLKTARVTHAGAYRFSDVPEGNYFVIAIRDDLADNWPAPEFLASLRPDAARITVRQGEKSTLSLRTMR